MLVIVPSRGRPHNVKDLIESFGKTRKRAELLVVIDTDDPKKDEYTALDWPVEWAHLTLQDRRRLGPTLNHYATQYTEKYDMIGFMGDDHRPRTDGWDVMLYAMTRDTAKTGIFYGNDLLQGANLPTAVFITSDIIRVLEYMCPEGMMHMYLDNVWKMWGEKIGHLYYMPSMIIEHMHPVASKAEWDEGYADVNSGEMYEHDERAMYHYIETKLDRDIAKIKELL